MIATKTSIALRISEGSKPLRRGGSHSRARTLPERGPSAQEERARRRLGARRNARPLVCGPSSAAASCGGGVPEGRVIKYLGSKRLLVPWIVETVGRCEARTACSTCSPAPRASAARSSRGPPRARERPQRVRAHRSARATSAPTRARRPRGAVDRRARRAARQARLVHRDVLRALALPAAGERRARGRDPRPHRGACRSSPSRGGRAHEPHGGRPTAWTPPSACRWPTPQSKGRALAPAAAPARAGDPRRPGSASCLDAAEAAERVEADLVYPRSAPTTSTATSGTTTCGNRSCAGTGPRCNGVAMKRTDVQASAAATSTAARRILPALAAVLERLEARWSSCRSATRATSRWTSCELLGRHGEVRESSVDHPRHIGHKIGV